VGHCAVRWWAMGKRSLEQKIADPEDVERMREIVREAISNGALGFSTSRTMLHKTPDGEPVPGTFAGIDELMGIARVLEEEGRGVFEAVTHLDSEDPEVHASELAWMTDLSLKTGRPVTFGLIQTRELPDIWKTVLAAVDAARARGANLRPQTQVRSVGVLFGLVNLTPWDMAGGTWGLLKLLPLEERVEAFSDPAKRAKLLEDAKAGPFGERTFENLYLLREEGGETRYDCRPEDSLMALARRRGTSAVETFMDVSVESAGRALFLYPFANFDFDVVETMLTHPQVLLGLADSGAHCGQIMDASLPSYLLSYWVRERGVFSIEAAIEKLTSEPARFFGLADRGLVREGAYADLNVIDLAGLRVLAPEYVQDFPAGASRYIQRSAGITHTLVNGQLFMEDGEHTGAFAGTVLRSTT